MHSPLAAALIFVGFAILVTGAYAWLIVAAKAALSWAIVPGPIASTLASLLDSLGFASRLPLISWTPRQPVPWGLIDLIGIVGLQVAAGTMLHGVKLIPEGKLEDLTLPEKRTVIAWNVGLSLLVALLSVLLVTIRTRATARDLGWSWHDIAADIRLGLIAFVMLAPPVYALQGLLVSLWKESKHPIVEMFKTEPDARFFGALLISAAVVAPLFEELLFRVLLQGFLEKVFTFGGDLQELLLGTVNREDEAPAEPPFVQQEAGQQEMILDELNPKSKIQNPKSEQPELRNAAAWLPIAISSTIFALLHYSHGPDWIPLLLLAAGMGYLYQRTHRILPSLVVHSLLNTLSMWGLWVAVKERALTP